MEKYNFERKTMLCETELSQIFDIVANNMRSLGFEISSGDKEVWAKNLQQNLLDEKFWLFNIYSDGKIVGFVEMGVFDNKLFLSELQLCDCVKNTRLLLFVLKKFIDNKAFEGFDKIYFNINKNNFKSRKTFEHLGGIVEKENQKTCCFVIEREKIERYLSKFSNI